MSKRANTTVIGAFVIGAIGLITGAVMLFGTGQFFHERVEVVTVVEPVPIYDTGFMVALPEAELFEARRDAVESEIRDQLEEVTGSRSPWPIHVEPGIPASRIVGLAETIEAEFLVMGIGRHGSMDRLFGREWYRSKNPQS